MITHYVKDMFSYNGIATCWVTPVSSYEEGLEQLRSMAVYWKKIVHGATIDETTATEEELKAFYQYCLPSCSVSIEKIDTPCEIETFIAEQEALRREVFLKGARVTLANINGDRRVVYMDEKRSVVNMDE